VRIDIRSSERRQLSLAEKLARFGSNVGPTAIEVAAQGRHHRVISHHDNIDMHPVLDGLGIR
jgi:hypothetical protein